MSKRVISALMLLLIGFPALAIGGIPYFLLIGFFLGAAAWEYVDMCQRAGSQPWRGLVVGGTLAVAAARFFFPEYSTTLFAFAILALMIYHLIRYERGRDQAGHDFSASIGGLVYIGWIGSYLLDLRSLENGGWWVMFVLPTVWLVDTGAYTLGAAYGTHRMTPRLSPKKTWEGFAAGVFTGGLGGGFLAFSYTHWGPLHLPIWVGAIFGIVMGILSPLGDLGESMFKRQAGMKDSGNILPGHGGAFDRIDTWIWAAVLGYYFIIWFVQ
jgi:phosphatidate cytidylyltransferase